MKEPLIELRGVSKRFGDNVILEGLDLTIYRGEALVIIGPSGTGKSTVLRVIAGLTGINAGEIRIKGQLRQGLLEDGREAMRTSLVFQQTALFDSLTVGENVGFYRELVTFIPQNYRGECVNGWLLPALLSLIPIIRPITLNYCYMMNLPQD
jgi:ABC-type transporter Mla maintaining outer membrane lipid asymmetry ATPase subunit MlaF